MNFYPEFASMNPIVFAMRRPITVMVAMVAILFSAMLALQRMSIDIFPELETPLIYVVQPYGGMDPAQMEGYITNYTEFYFLLITGIHHVESMNIQSIAMTKLAFHPGTNMAAAMAETVNYVNRSKAFMPPGTLPPIIMRYDASSVPVGFLVFDSKTKTVGQIQDEATFKVRPYLASLRGVSAPPSFGGDARTIVTRLDPERLRAYSLSPDDVVKALTTGNQVYPSGNVVIGDRFPIVPVNSVVTDIKDLGKIPIRVGQSPQVYLRDIGSVADETDVPVGYTLVNGHRSVDFADHQTSGCLDAVGGQPCQGKLPQMRKALSHGHRAELRVRSVALRGPRCGRRGPGRDPRGRADRADDSAVPGRLAQRGGRGADDSAGLAVRHRGHVAHRPVDQHHDAGRFGTGHRHPGG